MPQKQKLLGHSFSLFNTVAVLVGGHSYVFFENEGKRRNGVETKLVGNLRKGKSFPYQLFSLVDF